MELDYQNLGLKAGLECHQQLDTGKLFCRCPSVLRDDKPDIVIRRYLRPVASELGEFDPAALEQYKKGYSYLYEGYFDTTCEIEFDESPPKPVDEEALKVILEVALLIGMHIPDELVVMRKAVIDGSNTSGFQKTMLVATGGRLSLKSKDLNVQTLALEEDAARPMEKRDKEIVYRLDRLGIPLIELATAPELHTPEEAKEAALEIGNLFRLTGKAKRGLGTIRQDLNISIKDGARVEIKGIQQLEIIDECVRREVQRQLSLIEIRNELKSRGIEESDLENLPVDVSREFENTNSNLIKNCLGKCIVLAVRIKGFAGIIGKELQPGRRLGTEVADYVRVKTGVKGILHSDELPAFGISKEEIEAVEQRVNCDKGDAFVLVCAEEDKVGKAIDVVVERCKQALAGVPEETRDALDGGNTSYSRPLPGAARMYPETDLEPIRISEKYLEEIRKSLPKSANERRAVYIKKYGLSEKLADKMKLSNYAKFFEQLVERGYDAKTAAVLLLEGLVQLRREGIKVGGISNEMIESVLKALKEKKITQDVMLEVLANWAREKGKSLDEIIKGMSIEVVASAEVEEIVKRVVEKNKELIKDKGIHGAKALMGEVMKEVRGRASGSEVNSILMREVEKVLNE